MCACVGLLFLDVQGAGLHAVNASGCMCGSHAVDNLMKTPLAHAQHTGIW
jgi:hypothetical protein